MSEVRGFRDLEIWQRGMDLVVRCYALTATLPKEKLYGLRSQINRAAVSVPSNIAEGHTRQTPGAFRNQLTVARGSLAEIETQIEICVRLGFVEAPRVEDLLDEIGQVSRMTAGLIRSLKQKEGGKS